MTTTGTHQQDLIDLVESLATATEALQPSTTPESLAADDVHACLQQLWVNSPQLQSLPYLQSVKARIWQDAWSYLRASQTATQQDNSASCDAPQRGQPQRAAVVETCLQLQQARWQQDVQLLQQDDRWAYAPATTTTADMKVAGDEQADRWGAGEQQHKASWSVQDSSSSTARRTTSSHRGGAQVLQLQRSNDEEAIAGRIRLISSAGSDPECNLMQMCGDIGAEGFEQLDLHSDSRLASEGYNSEGGALEPGWMVMGADGGYDHTHSNKIGTAVRKLQRHMQQAEPGDANSSASVLSTLRYLVQQSPDDVLSADCWPTFCSTLRGLLCATAAAWNHTISSPNIDSDNVVPQLAGSPEHGVGMQGNVALQPLAQPKPISRDKEQSVVTVVMQLLSQVTVECCATSPCHAAQLLQAVLPVISCPCCSSVAALEAGDYDKGLLCMAACAAQLLRCLAQDWYFLPASAQESCASAICVTLAAVLSQPVLGQGIKAVPEQDVKALLEQGVKSALQQGVNPVPARGRVSRAGYQLQGSRAQVTGLHLMLRVDPMCSWLPRLCSCSNTARQLAGAASSPFNRGCSHDKGDQTEGLVEEGSCPALLHIVQRLLVEQQQQLSAAQLHLLVCVSMGLLCIPSVCWSGTAAPTKSGAATAAAATQSSSSSPAAVEMAASSQPGYAPSSFAPMSELPVRQAMLASLLQLLHSHWAASSHRHLCDNDEQRLFSAVRQLLLQLASAQPQLWDCKDTMQQLCVWAMPEQPQSALHQQPQSPLHQQPQSALHQAAADLAVAVCGCLAESPAGADVLLAAPLATPEATAHGNSRAQVPLLLMHACKALSADCKVSSVGSKAGQTLQARHWQLLQVLATAVARPNQDLQAQQLCSDLVAEQLLQVLQYHVHQAHATYNTATATASSSSSSTHLGCALDTLTSWVCATPTLLVRLHERPHVVTALAQRVLHHWNVAMSIKGDICFTEGSAVQPHPARNDSLSPTQDSVSESAMTTQGCGHRAGEHAPRLAGIAGMLAIDSTLMQGSLLEAGWLDNIMYQLSLAAPCWQTQGRQYPNRTFTAARVCVDNPPLMGDASGAERIAMQVLAAAQACLSWAGVHVQLQQLPDMHTWQGQHGGGASVNCSTGILQRLVASLNPNARLTGHAPLDHADSSACAQPAGPSNSCFSIGKAQQSAEQLEGSLLTPDIALACLAVWACQPDALASLDAGTDVTTHLRALLHGTSLSKPADVENKAGAGLDTVESQSTSTAATAAAEQQLVLQKDEPTKPALSLLQGLARARAVAAAVAAAGQEHQPQPGRLMGVSTSMRKGAVADVVRSDAGMPDPEAWLRDAASALQADIQHAQALDWRAVLLLLQRCVLVAWPGVRAKAPCSEVASWARMQQHMSDGQLNHLPWQHVVLHYTKTHMIGEAPSAMALQTAATTLTGLAHGHSTADSSSTPASDCLQSAAEVVDGNLSAADMQRLLQSDAAVGPANSAQKLNGLDSAQSQAQSSTVTLGQEGCSARSLAVWLDGLCITINQLPKNNHRVTTQQQPVKQQSVGREQAVARQHSLPRQHSLAKQLSVAQQQSLAKQQSGHLTAMPQPVPPQADRLVAVLGALGGVASSKEVAAPCHAAVDLLQGLLQAPMAMYIWPGLAVSCRPAGYTLPAAAVSMALSYVLRQATPRIWTAAGGHASVGTSTLLHHCIRWLGFSPSAAIVDASGGPKGGVNAIDSSSDASHGIRCTRAAGLAWWGVLPAEQAMIALALTITCGPDYLVYCCVAALASVEEALLAAAQPPGDLIAWLSTEPLQQLTWAPLMPHIAALCAQYRHTVLPFLMSQLNQPG